MAIKNVRKVPGDEYDQPLRDALLAALKYREATAVSASTWIGGSQELDEARFELDGYLITVDAETYIGIAISGPEFLVDDLVNDIVSRLSRSGRKNNL